MNHTDLLGKKVTVKAATWGLALALCCQGLAGCSKPTSPAPGASPPRSTTDVSPSPIASPVAASSPVELADGRVLSEANTPPDLTRETLEVLEREVKRAAKEPVLAKIVGSEIDLNEQNFKVVGMAEGSFTQAGSSQRIYLYQLGLTDGLIVLENNAVVGHFSGGPGDYAHYVKLVSVDVDGDGWSDLVLERNVEDTDDIYAYLFKTTAAGPKFEGESPVYTSSVQAGEENDPSKVESTAYLIAVTPGQALYTHQTFERKSTGNWTESASTREPIWQNRFPSGEEPAFVNLLQDLVDPARLKEAIGKLGSYSDVPSSIDFASLKNEAEMLIATDPTLQLMEILDTRAAVYAYENATKEEVDHSDVKRFALSLDGLKTSDEIKEAYIKRTNESLGGESPYQE